ncbi:epoxyqueuosine reductase [Ereboglobus sp. PH5-10]|uniref:tRNA epoxyqueuosine(34) reductase QueG n=1 Tax=Ereboglobus sp. PH5-10 TaxID=2940629 RepID=UPI002406917A|nr:tRNA epoxyqueuosine(34) reductase QueG [Ereboglobus sp. PH5-10]MDF9826465.1 epoxyqueuosine reductase [Ereboglobus sp. PH5-10]
MIEPAELRKRLLALGFDVARFASIPARDDGGALPEVNALRKWLDAGYQADMHWIERGFAKRASPTLVLPDAGSVIMLGVNYFQGAAGASSDSRHPRWARYALYSDYHDTIKPALEKAGRVIEETLGLTSADYRYYADTGPVLERAWAERAGAGFIGKNAMLVSRDFGNWLFLAAILVRAKIKADEPLPARSHCGKCTRCIDACPTGAIASPGTLDSRLCISYQTIENKGAIPRGLRAKIGARIYGCDACAETCPWNRFAQASRGLLLEARPEITRLSLNELLALTPESFAAHFRKTAIKRIKLAGLLRNACIVAGNTGARAAEHLPQLSRLAAHESPLVRAHAVWAVRRIADRELATRLLAEARNAEKDAAVLDEYGAQP